MGPGFFADVLSLALNTINGESKMILIMTKGICNSLIFESICLAYIYRHICHSYAHSFVFISFLSRFSINTVSLNIHNVISLWDLLLLLCSNNGRMHTSIYACDTMTRRRKRRRRKKRKIKKMRRPLLSDITVFFSFSSFLDRTICICLAFFFSRSLHISSSNE